MHAHRCRPPETLERQRVPTSDDAPDAADRRSTQKDVRPRERDQSRETRTLLVPEEGRRTPRDPTGRGNATEEGERGDNRTAREHTAHTTHARHARVAVAAQDVDASGRVARDGRHGDEPETSGTGSPPPTLPLPGSRRPQREERYRARGRVRGPSPTTTTSTPRQTPTAPHQRQDDKLCPA